MKKLLVAVTIIMAISWSVFGCIPKREVIGNNYISSYPKINIKFHPEFRHWGTYRSESTESDYSDPTGIKKSKNGIELTLFVPKEMQNQNYDKGIFIYFREILTQGWHYVGSAYSSTNKYVLINGVTTFGGDQYEHATRIAFNNTNDHISHQIFKAGLSMPLCALFKSYARTYGENLRIFINYFEDVSQSGFEGNRWLDKTRYSEAQHKYIKEFEKRASNALEIQ